MINLTTRVILRGKYEQNCVYNDEDLDGKAREWVREHAFKKRA